MRISDWSSDVCSSDLRKPDRRPQLRQSHLVSAAALSRTGEAPPLPDPAHHRHADAGIRRESGVDRATDGAYEHADVVHRVLALRAEPDATGWLRSEEHTSELQSLMRTSYAVFCLK